MTLAKERLRTVSIALTALHSWMPIRVDLRAFKLFLPCGRMSCQFNVLDKMPGSGFGVPCPFPDAALRKLNCPWFQNHP